MSPIALTATALDDSSITIALSGELDIATVGRIEPVLSRLATGRAPEVRLDLSGVTFCDSSGVALFLRVHQRCAAKGGRLRLCLVPRLCAKMLRVLRVDDTIPCSFA
ncbi:STAS domain-containing protein [Streptomyces vilmorinianum]|uniref:STAS domain-containing protein n=1 Tax=Streptomyces vilmorinianum TaxID=3051092 RepID=UPI00158630AB|nr:STAS domain-containing protein [Streptomyces vilmorinianum]